MIASTTHRNKSECTNGYEHRRQSNGESLLVNKSTTGRCTFHPCYTCHVVVPTLHVRTLHVAPWTTQHDPSRSDDLSTSVPRACHAIYGLHGNRTELHDDLELEERRRTLPQATSDSQKPSQAMSEHHASSMPMDLCCETPFCRSLRWQLSAR